MPTPVSVARQCLADEAAAALDDAVMVAKRRSHAQTTSLHAVSAFLSQPTLRDACVRASRSAHSSRLQLRALELCVGVALDRVSVSKTNVGDPPVSNSLMAAIKRSQANQRRHPDTFHLYQLNSSSSQSISVVKVDMKHFVTSILDDPIVNRVFGDAGFRTGEIKWGILNPVSSISRFSSRCPPVFMSGLDLGEGKGNPSFDDSSRRIGEVLRSARNPLLVGVYASDALRDFVEGLRSGGGVSDGLRVVSIESEVSGFVSGGSSEEVLVGKFREVGEMAAGSCGPGVLVSVGDLKALAGGDAEDLGGSASFVVGEVRRLLGECVGKGKVQLIGAVAGDYDYKRVVERFPTIEADWGLQLLPITSASPKVFSIGASSFKSSLMGSFVPLGGFFPMPSKPEILRTRATQSSTLCISCKEKYEHEVYVSLKGESINSVSDKQSVNISPWLQAPQCQSSNGSDALLAKDDKTVLDAKVMAIQKKWSDICHQLHFSWTSQEDISPAKSKGSSTCTSSPAVVTTDLELGTLYSLPKEASNKLEEHNNVMQNSSESPRTYKYTFNQFFQPVYSQPMEKEIYTKDVEYPWKFLAEKVYWQTEAIQTISQSLSHCKNKGNIWLSFLGPDKVGKRKIAAAVAEIIFGKTEHLRSFDLSPQDVVSTSNSIFDSFDTKYHGMMSGRKMIVDYLADELSKRPQCVLLLENIEKADIVVQNSLTKAVKTGKFQDSRGREINLNKKVLILTSRILKGRKDLSGQLDSEFSEEKVLEAKHFQLQLLVEPVGGNRSRNNSTNVSVTPSKKDFNKYPMNKRKLIDYEPTRAEMSKRPSSRSIIDLNLPVEDAEDESKIDEYDDDNENSDNANSLLEELLEHVEENVIFKPFDFESRTREILKEIDEQLNETVGAHIMLEIEREVMVQILAAAWLTERKIGLKDWIEHVLCPSVKEAWQKLNVTSDVVMKLVTCDGLLVEEQASGVCLPARINTN